MVVELSLAFADLHEQIEMSFKESGFIVVMECPLWVLCHEHAGPNGMCNCTRDGGGPFEVGNQVLVSSHRKLLWSKAMVVSVAENRNEIPAGKIERGERKQTVGEVSKAD